MAMVGEIEHTTSYRYAEPVSFGTHRAMFLPRRGASARLLSWSAKTNIPSKIHWVSDSRSNTVTVLEFSEPRNELTFTFRVRGVYFGVKGVDAFPLAARAEEVPIQYTPDEWIDLAGYLRPHADDPDGSVAAWTKSFVAGDQDRTTDVYGGCWKRSAATLATARGKRRERSRPAKPCGRDRAPVATMPG
jgi:transglutaminase-like putative cysteine protease